MIINHSVLEIGNSTQNNLVRGSKFEEQVNLEGNNTVNSTKHHFIHFISVESDDSLADPNYEPDVVEDNQSECKHTIIYTIFNFL